MSHQSAPGFLLPKFKQTNHPHTHKYKTARWIALRREVLVRDLFTCRMCGVLLSEGRQSPRSAVVDHLEPAYLSPSLFFDQSNLWSVCKGCHDGPCASIEARHNDPSRIKAEKLNYVVAGHDADGRPTSPNHPWNRSA
ncbi:hypothetical protein GN330_16550 [Nitratireductor sp. CAU 1489]|uniref:HNH endonuclease n=1 Tax=Nitratireductor arenosus TaxID=2682096 RepID=A0A844QML8_9HYPH|nr:hypothetical protein [Nitratireductor arenosus]MVA98859.1 hypothetical protein [Nitratireductor arenosus]